uniref:N-acetyltransferase domain-containing protein n=1 Tax=viral metagenome TaxID=1070528 RepID=A0A6C0I1T0_9ZZZZ
MFFLIVLVILVILIALLIVTICKRRHNSHPYDYIPPHKYYNENIDYSNFPEQYDLKTMAKYIGGNDSNKLTYFNSDINSNNFDIISHIQKQLIKNGWRIADVENGEFTNFSFSQRAISDENTSQKDLALCGEIANLGLEFSNKAKMKKHFEDKPYFPKWSPGKLLIEKNNQSIKISESSASTLSDKSTLSDADVIQEQYISNPLLYEGKKFNLQVYLAIYARGADASGADASGADASGADAFVQAIINPNYNMQVSALPYSNSDYDNTGIHISNLDKSQITPPDAEFLKKILTKDVKTQIYHIIHNCEEISKTIMKKNTNTLAEFELITLDLLIDDVSKVWLMDMHRTLERSQKDTLYFDWVLNGVILPNFGIVDGIWGINPQSKSAPALALPAVVNHQLGIRPLNLATEEDLINLAKIGSMPEVYTYISNKHPWDAAYIHDIYNNAVKYASMLRRDYYHWLIIYNKECVGYVGIRPFYGNFSPDECKDKLQKCCQIRWFISPHHRGNKLSTFAGKHVVHFFKSIFPNKTLFANIDKLNMASIKTATAIGFKITESTQKFNILSI